MGQLCCSPAIIWQDNLIKVFKVINVFKAKISARGPPISQFSQAIEVIRQALEGMSASPFDQISKS
jgi:hypothetical protein